MRITKRISAMILGAALVLAVCIHSVHAGNKRPARGIPAYYNGDIVYVVPGNNQNVVGVDNQAIADHAANPIYFVYDTAGNLLQDPILSTVPGVAGYNPYWQVIYVVVPDVVLPQDADVSIPIVAEADIPAEWQIPTDTVLLCQVVHQ